MALPQARIGMPSQAARGEVIEVKLLMRHRMETGYRVDNRGQRIARDIIEHLDVSYAGKTVLSMDLTQGVSANPYLLFHLRAIETGDVVFEWRDNNGAVSSMRRTLTVSA